MPAIPPSLSVLSRSLDIPNGANNALQVICAWPVSGQYGPGTRALYYVLIATCVFGRRAEWLRNACLAAALLFPAIAGLHGIVLASLHNDSAVDMDVYGAFQFCSIGVLTAPVTVRLSQTYFNEPGRNIIFLWTGLILTGLVSLAVEFFRIKTHDCTVAGHQLSKDSNDFIYGNTTCGLTCSVDVGPFSPIRGGSANNIYVIPAPEKLTFGAATLLAAACCIPAILSIASMWNKILEINWTRRFGNANRNPKKDELIEGTNGATLGTMNKVNELIKSFLSVVEVPLFGAAVLVIIIIGEINFSSYSVRYQTEPFASIGQWAPIVGAGLAVLGSLSLSLAAAVDEEEEDAESGTSGSYSSSPRAGPSTDNGRALNATVDSAGFTTAQPKSPSNPRGASMEMVQATNRNTIGRLIRSQTEDLGSRRRVARALLVVSDYLSNAAHDPYYDHDFKHGPATTFPEIPGEGFRNSDLNRIRQQYNGDIDIDGPAAPESRGRLSRMGSFTGSVSSRIDPEHSPTTPRAASPSPSLAQRSRASMSQVRKSSDIQDPSSPAHAARPQGNTLEVPPRVHYPAARIRSSTSPVRPTGGPPVGDNAPTIVVSPDPDVLSPAHGPSRSPRAPP